MEVGDIILYHMADIDDEEGDGYLVQVYPMAQELDGLLPELEVEFVREMITVWYDGEEEEVEESMKAWMEEEEEDKNVAPAAQVSAAAAAAVLPMW